jgi:Bacterial capsule synthesis protein PGA_cap
VASSDEEAADGMDFVSFAGLSMKAVEKAGRLVVWQAAIRQPIVSRIAIAGDFLPGGNLTLSAENEWVQPALRLEAQFDDIDTTFLNLEATLDTGGLAPRKLNGLGDIVSAPAAALDYLRAIRARAVGMANNHTYDFGDRGVERSRVAIEHCGLVGVGGDSQRLEQPDVFIWKEPDSVRVGFWAAARASSDTTADRERGVEPATVSRGQQAFKILQRRGANFCIALLHSGCMRTSRPEPEDLGLMNSLAQVGFDLVAASHSHRIAGYQRVQRAGRGDGFCFFGLGSLVSGYAKSEPEREGLIVVAGLDGKGALVTLEVRPVIIDATGFGTIPGAADFEMMVNRFQSLSAEISDGSYEDEFYREVSRGLGRLYARDIRAAFRAAGLRGLARKAGRVRMRHVKRFFRRVSV